jgi:hypothetical protein
MELAPGVVSYEAYNPTTTVTTRRESLVVAIVLFVIAAAITFIVIYVVVRLNYTYIESNIAQGARNFFNTTIQPVINAIDPETLVIIFDLCSIAPPPPTS